MQKEEKRRLFVLFLMALGSLAMAEWAFGDSNQSAASGKPDSAISVEGRVLDIKTTKTSGNLVFRLDNANKPSFVPSSSGAKDIQSRVHSGDQVRIRGMLSDFNGKK